MKSDREVKTIAKQMAIDKYGKVNKDFQEGIIIGYNLAKSEKLFTGYYDKNDLPIMIGDTVKLPGIRGGFYNNDDIIFKVDHCNRFFMDGYNFNGIEIIQPVAKSKK